MFIYIHYSMFQIIYRNFSCIEPTLYLYKFSLISTTQHIIYQLVQLVKKQIKLCHSISNFSTTSTSPTYKKTHYKSTREPPISSAAGRRPLPLIFPPFPPLYLHWFTPGTCRYRNSTLIPHQEIKISSSRMFGPSGGLRRVATPS